MKIYIDGCDGTGKSTLAKYLSDRFKLDIFYMSKDSERSIMKYCERICIDDVVYDRTFISETIYPMVFGRDTTLSPEDVESLLDYYDNPNSLFVICTAPEEIIRARLFWREGSEDSNVLDNLLYINDKYVEFAYKHNLMLVDTDELSLEEIGDEIERRLKNGKH